MENNFERIIEICFINKVNLPFTNIFIESIIEDLYENYYIWRNDPSMVTNTKFNTHRGGGTNLDGIRELIKRDEFILVSN